MKNVEGQESLFDLGLWYGKTSPDSSVLQRKTEEKISGSSSKKSAALSTVPYQFLDLRKGHGSLLGALWEITSPSRGESKMLNTGECPSAAVESSLSQILQDNPPRKYFLSPKACRGILRRARKRGKDMPPMLKEALEKQAGAA